MIADFHEKVEAALLGGKRTPRSGAGHIKGDVLTDGLLVECKATVRETFTVTSGLLRSVCREAALMRRRACLSVMSVAGNPDIPSSLWVRWLIRLTHSDKPCSAQPRCERIRVTYPIQQFEVCLAGDHLLWKIEVHMVDSPQTAFSKPTKNGKKSRSKSLSKRENKTTS